jgi:hypothetical protein
MSELLFPAPEIRGPYAFQIPRSLTVTKLIQSY